MLKPVLVNGSEFGITNGQEWHYPNNSLNELSQTKERRYSLRIAFAAYQHGTYRQSVLLDFRRCLFLQKICADYLPINDYARIQTATNYQLSQIPPKWNDLLAFYSPSLSHVNSREIMLSKIYPYPNQQNFFLTQNTLSEDRLTRRNYRGRMHEIITLEEIARQEQLSRYNQVSMIRLLSHYKLTISDGSTIEKYALPGELFAQVRPLRVFFYLHPLSYSHSRYRAWRVNDPCIHRTECDRFDRFGVGAYLISRCIFFFFFFFFLICPYVHLLACKLRLNSQLALS